MACSTEKLFQLKFVVKTITRCSRPEDRDCSMSICIRFLDVSEQFVCEIPPIDKCSRPDSGAAVIPVHQGKTFTFMMPVGGSCGPKPMRLAVKLYRLMGPDTLPNRTELASGELDVAPKMVQLPSSDDCDDDADETTVSLMDCQDSRTVAVLTVSTRAWCAGTVMSSRVDPSIRPVSGCYERRLVTPPSSPDCCSQRIKICGEPCKCCSTPVSCCKPTPCVKPVSCCKPQTPCIKPVSCCKPQTPCIKPVSCCKPQTPCIKPVSCCKPTSCNKPLPCSKPLTCCKPVPCGNCNLARRQNEAACAELNANRQYTTIGCEIDGRKIDMRLRKKNYETCAVQKRITSEAEAFASRVVAAVKGMHGLVMDSTDPKSDDP